MLTRRELHAFCIAAFTAPVTASVLMGRVQVFAVVAAIAYIAALALGAPIFAWMRARGWPLAARALASGALAGFASAMLVMALVLIAFPPRHFLGDPTPTLVVVAVFLAWGVGLGVLAGLALFALLRASNGPTPMNAPTT